MDAEEVQLLRESANIGRKWYERAYKYLKNQNHWWCRHSDLCYHFLDLVPQHYEQRDIKTIWDRMSQDISNCIDCQQAYYAVRQRVQQHCLPDLASSQSASLQALDFARVQRVLAMAPELLDDTLQHPEDKVASVCYAVHEALLYDYLLQDASTCSALLSALAIVKNKSVFKSQGRGRRYPGLYRLLAHPQQNARSLAAELIQADQSFTSWQEAEETCGALLAEWGQLLQAWHAAGGLASSNPDNLQTLPQPVDQIEGRPCFDQPAEPVWLAVEMILQLLPDDGAVQQIMLLRHPQLLRVMLVSVGKPPEHNAADGFLRLYQTIVGCLDLVIRSVGPALWLQAPHAEHLGQPQTLTSSSEMVDKAMGAMSNVHHESLHGVTLQMVTSLLHALADASSREDHHMHRLLRFMLQEVYQSGEWCKPALSSITKCLAAQGSLSGIRRAITRSCYSTSLGAHIWGERACAEVCQPPRQQGDQQAAKQLQQEAAQLCCAVLQIDSTVLGALLEPARLEIQPMRAGVVLAAFNGVPDRTPQEWLTALTSTQPEKHVLATRHVSNAAPWISCSHSSSGWALPPMLRICPSVWVEQDVSAAAEAQLQAVYGATCCPAYWEACRRSCTHPAVAAAMLNAVAHVAGINSTAPSAKQGKASATHGKTPGGNGNMYRNLHTDLADNIQLRFPSSDASPPAVKASAHRHGLLYVLRRIGYAYLMRASQSSHILGPAYTEYIQSYADELKHVGGQVEQQLKHWTACAVRATARIFMGADAVMSCQALAALFAHCGLSLPHEAKLYDLLVACPPEHVQLVFNCLLEALEEAIRHLDAQPATQVASSDHLFHIMDCMRNLILAQDVWATHMPLLSRLSTICASCLCVIHKLLLLPAANLPPQLTLTLAVQVVSGCHHYYLWAHGKAIMQHASADQVEAFQVMAPAVTASLRLLLASAAALLAMHSSSRNKLISALAGHAGSSATPMSEGLKDAYLKAFQALTDKHTCTPEVIEAVRHVVSAGAHHSLGSFTTRLYEIYPQVAPQRVAGLLRNPLADLPSRISSPEGRQAAASQATGASRPAAQQQLHVRQSRLESAWAATAASPATKAKMMVIDLTEAEMEDGACGAQPTATQGDAAKVAHGTQVSMAAIPHVVTPPSNRPVRSRFLQALPAAGVDQDEDDEDELPLSEKLRRRSGQFTNAGLQPAPRALAFAAVEAKQPQEHQQPKQEQQQHLHTVPASTALGASNAAITQAAAALVQRVHGVPFARAAPVSVPQGQAKAKPASGASRPQIGSPTGRMKQLTLDLFGATPKSPPAEAQEAFPALAAVMWPPAAPSAQQPVTQGAPTHPAQAPAQARWPAPAMQQPAKQVALPAAAQAHVPAAAMQQPAKQLAQPAAAQVPVPAAAAAVQQPPAQPEELPKVSLVVDDDMFEMFDKAYEARWQLGQQQRQRGLVASMPPCAEPRQVQMLHGPVKKSMQMRAAPPRPALRIEEVHQELLKWDLQTNVLAGQLPGAVTSAVGRGPSGSGDRQVAFPRHFPDGLQSYVNTFKGLLLEELRATIAAAVEELAAGGDLVTTELKVNHIQRESSSQTLSCTVIQPVDNRNSYSYQNNRSVRTDDLLLFTVKPLKSAGTLTSGLPDLRIMAMVTDVTLYGGQVNQLQCKVVMPAGTDAPMITFGTGKLAGPARIHDKLVTNSTWHATVLTTLTPQMREFQALCAVHTLPEQLRTFLLTPTPPSKASAGPQVTTITSREAAEQALEQAGVPEPMREALANHYNPSQQAAIATALDKSCQVSLIQGPPGTGKTSSILAIISVLLAGCRQASAGGPSTDAGTSNQHVQSGTAARPIPTYKKPSAAIRRQKEKEAEAAAKQADGGAAAASDSEEAEPIKLGTTPPIRILVCAQSNAAIDELVVRLAKDRLLCKDGGRRLPGIVRLGRLEKTHDDVRHYYVDALVERLSGQNAPCTAAHSKQDAARELANELRLAKQRCEDELNALEAKVNALRHAHRAAHNPDGDDMDLDAQVVTDEAVNAAAGVDAEDIQRINDLRRQLWKARTELNNAEMDKRNSHRDYERARKDLRQSVMRAAEITVCTLSVAGGELSPQSWTSTVQGSAVTAAPSYDALVIDEAAQALEPATLIPFVLLKPGAKIVLVGDPRQLPPTVLSQTASQKLSQSLFQRLHLAGVPIHMLALQYRMHPTISRFPSMYFYEAALLDGVGVSQRTQQHHGVSPGLGPLVVWDIHEGKEGRSRGNKNRSSLVNYAEADFAVALYRVLMSVQPGFSGSVAVISPYKAQVHELQRAFGPYMPSQDGAGMILASQAGSSSQPNQTSALHTVEFSTVDGFQGREADIVIFSCVRAAVTASSTKDASDLGATSSGSRLANGLGFLNDVRRMNVALTRARCSLWVVGHAATLRGSAPWAALLQHAEGLDQLLKATGSRFQDYKTCIMQAASHHAQHKDRQGGMQHSAGSIREHPQSDKHARSRVRKDMSPSQTRDNDQPAPKRSKTAAVGKLSVPQPDQEKHEHGKKAVPPPQPPLPSSPPSPCPGSDMDMDDMDLPPHLRSSALANGHKRSGSMQKEGAGVEHALIPLGRHVGSRGIAAWQARTRDEHGVSANGVPNLSLDNGHAPRSGAKLQQTDSDNGHRAAGDQCNRARDDDRWDGQGGHSSRERGRQQGRDRERESGRDKQWDRDVDRETERNRERDRDRDMGRDRGISRERDREEIRNSRYADSDKDSSRERARAGSLGAEHKRTATRAGSLQGEGHVGHEPVSASAAHTEVLKAGKRDRHDSGTGRQVEESREGQQQVQRETVAAQGQHHNKPQGNGSSNRSPVDVFPSRATEARSTGAALKIGNQQPKASGSSNRSPVDVFPSRAQEARSTGAALRTGNQQPMALGAGPVVSNGNGRATLEARTVGQRPQAARDRNVQPAVPSRDAPAVPRAATATGMAGSTSAAAAVGAINRQGPAGPPIRPRAAGPLPVGFRAMPRPINRPAPAQARMNTSSGQGQDKSQSKPGMSEAQMKLLQHVRGTGK